MSTLFTFDQSFQYFSCCQTQQNCNFHCPPAGERKLRPMGFKPGTKQAPSRLTARVRPSALLVMWHISHKILPLPLTITDHQPQMPGPHLKMIPNRLEWHVTAFLEPCGPPLESFHFLIVCWAYLVQKVAATGNQMRATPLAN